MVTKFPQKWWSKGIEKTGCKIPLPLSPKSLWMLDKPEVLAGVTQQPRFLPWEFDTGCRDAMNLLYCCFSSIWSFRVFIIYLLCWFTLYRAIWPTMAIFSSSRHMCARGIYLCWAPPLWGFIWVYWTVVVGNSSICKRKNAGCASLWSTHRCATTTILGVSHLGACIITEAILILTSHVVTFTINFCRAPWQKCVCTVIIWFRAWFG